MVHGSLPSSYCLAVRLCPVPVSAGLIIPRGVCVSGLTCVPLQLCPMLWDMSSDVMWYAGQSGHAIYRGSRGNEVRSSRIRHQNALTEKAWEDAVQGLGNIWLSIVWKPNRAKQKTPRVRTGELLSLCGKLPFFAQQLWSQAGYATTEIWGEKYLRSRKLFWACNKTCPLRISAYFHIF